MLIGATLDSGADATHRIANIAALDRAGPADLALIDPVSEPTAPTPSSHAGACIVSAELRHAVPQRSIALVVSEPYRAFVEVARVLFPDTARPSSLMAAVGIAPAAHIDPSARVENDVTIEPGVAIGPDVEIGAGTLIAAGTVIGRAVRIGRDCAIGPNSTISHALIGDRVTIRSGCRIGQGGFGFDSRNSACRPQPHLGRVIIQDGVAIGAGTTIDRGAVGDTVIGEGARIDSLTTIAQNVTIGRHCIVVAQAGIAEGAVLEDHVVLGSRVLVAGRVRIGEGARIAEASLVREEVPPATAAQSNR